MGVEARTDHRLKLTGVLPDSLTTPAAGPCRRRPGRGEAARQCKHNADTDGAISNLDLAEVARIESKFASDTCEEQVSARKLAITKAVAIQKQTRDERLCKTTP